ncbi:MAG: Y-family DNA polymerase [Alcaligenes sp.]
MYLCLRLPQNLLTPEGSSEQQDGIQAVLLRYSPQLARVQADLWVLNINASIRLFGGVRSLYRSIQADLQAFILTPRLALAPTARAACLLSLSKRPQRRCWRRLHACLNPLPIHLLAPPADQLQWLDNLGCHTLGQLHQLPRDGLSQRGLRPLLLQLDQAYGTQSWTLDWVHAAPHFTHRLELDNPSNNKTAVLRSVNRMLNKLEGWLNQYQLACGRLELILHTERYKDSPTATSLELQMARSCWRSQDFLPVWQEQFQQLHLQAAVQSLVLTAQQLHPRQTHASSLFPDARHWQEQDQQLLERLQARLGAEQILTPAAQASYLPEQANRWLALQADPPDCALAPALQRPCWMLDPAQPLQHDHQSPCLDNQRLRLIQGPERVQTAWWSGSGHQQRDYFIAQCPQGRLYWVYRDLSQEHAWYLHGVFG